MTQVSILVNFLTGMTITIITISITTTSTLSPAAFFVVIYVTTDIIVFTSMTFISPILKVQENSRLCCIGINLNLVGSRGIDHYSIQY